jgi:Tol biopolymer transport system component
MEPHRRRAGAAVAGAVLALTSCTAPSDEDASAPQQTPAASDARTADEPIDVAAMPGRIAVTSEDDIYLANADGTDLHRLTDAAGPEMDPAWSPDGSRVVYRDSRRGINENDEIYVANADGTGATNLTEHPANDWGPDWSPDGRTIVFNSDRDGLPMGGYLMNPDGTDVRRIPTDVWVEYPAWSPDGERIAFMSASAGNYDVWVVGTDGSDPVQLTDSPGHDGWPAWSPDGERIAFTSVRDDCSLSDEPDCRTTDTGEDDEHHDIWVVNADGAGLARVTPEFGQFVTWSPDGQHLLVWGYELFVVRPDGTGRTPLRIPGLADGVFPDWIA